MSQWYYQMLGEEFGPVSEEGLKQLIADGMLDATDPVRPADSSDWRPVNQTDLMPAADAPTDVLTDLNELNFRFEESGATDRSARKPGTAVQPPTAVEVPEAAPAPAWFHQFSGQVLGPISLQELVQLAESGNLSEADSVRCGVTAEWQPAGDVPELAAVFILSTGGHTAQGPQASAGSGRSLFAAAAAQAEKVKAQAAAERAAERAAAAAAAASAAAAQSQATTPPKSSTSDSDARSGKANGSRGRRGGKKSEEQLVENILSEVFAEPAAPRETSSNRPAEQSASVGGTNTSESRPPATMADNSSSAPTSSATSAGSGWSGSAASPAAAPRPTLSAPAPARARSSGSKSSGGGFSLPTGQVPVIGGVILLAVVCWFGYGYVNRLISVDEPKYIRRVEESLAALEKLSPQASQTELDTLQSEIYREFNEYIRTMTGAGATTGNSKKCLAAINRLTELIRVDPNRNPELRKKLMADAKQMVSEWKANK